jgi:hypothetical protein
LDRSRARSAIGGGFPASPFRLRGGVTIPPWPTFPEAPVFILDGRISRVQLATMTFIRSLPIAPRWLKCSPTYTRVAPVCCKARYPCTVYPLIRRNVLMGAHDVSAMTESPFAPSGCCPSGSNVYRYLGQHYPALIAHTDSCADPRSSARLHFGSVNSLCRLL